MCMIINNRPRNSSNRYPYRRTAAGLYGFALAPSLDNHSAASPAAGRFAVRSNPCLGQPMGGNKDCLPSARNRSREGVLCLGSANEGDRKGDKGELANAEPSVQPSDSQDRNSRRGNGGRHCYANYEDDYRPHPTRRRISTSILATHGTATKRQPHPHCAGSRSQQVQRPSKRPKRRSQRSTPSPPSSGASTLEEETVKVPVAKFEEWPLRNAVLKRVTVGEVATF
ncbi:hypothetical protein DL768_008054 [Monosporascus sp. mg162]|nr:hypothetical protein DL768_008054 [Monosporascus sp. mg162]